MCGVGGGLVVGGVLTVGGPGDCRARGCVGQGVRTVLRHPRRARRPGSPDTAPVASYIRLNRMLITGERRLRMVLSEYIDRYNVHRPHRALQQSPPAGRRYPPALGTNVRVLRRHRLGGLIREHAQVA